MILTYSLEKRGKLPVYEFLTNCMRDDILSGKLKAGERLPAKRVLAEHLGISVITVQSAYAQLLIEGYIESVERRGYFVCKLEDVPPARDAVSQPNPPESPAAQRYFADFTMTRPLPRQFPYSVWARLMRTVLSEQDPALLAPMPGQGLWQLRAAICVYLERIRGMHVQPSQIVVGGGTEFLYGLIVQLLGRDRTYAVEDPGYRRAAQTFHAHGASCVSVPLDEHGLSIEALEHSGATVAHLSPAHHFPTGKVTPIARRRELLRWAEQGNYLIEDDYDSEFRFKGRPVPTLQSMDTTGHVLYLNTFSKTLTPAIRIGFLVLPPGLAEQFATHPVACTVSSFEQMTLAKFLSEGCFETHLARSRHVYRRSRDALIAAIRATPLGDRCTIEEQDSGLHFLLRFTPTCPDYELVTRAAEQGIHVNCLSSYYADPATAPQGCLVLNYTGIPTDSMPEAAERLSRAIVGQ